MQTMEKLTERFLALRDVILRIGSEIKVSTLPMTIRFRRLVVHDFHTPPAGVTPHRGQYQDSYKPSWHKAEAATFEQVKESPEYASLMTELQTTFSKAINYEDVLYRATQILISDFFYERPARSFPTFVAILGKNINNEPVLACTEIEVHGFEIHVPRIEIFIGEKHFIFRQREIADFQREVEDYDVRQNMLWNAPSFFLRIEMPARSPHELQIETLKAECALRLFKVCSCSCAGQSFQSESILGFFQGSTSGAPKRGIHTFELKAGQESELRTFWSQYYEKVPLQFCQWEQHDEDFLEVAYDRYCDALFHTGRPEGKIAFAAMGLEAIFLGSKEKSELQYKLALRITKLFSKLGCDINEIRTQIGVAYGIRSVYVHGGHLTGEQRKEREKRLKNSIDSLGSQLLNYLRISILLFVVWNVTKKDILELIEQSLFSNVKDEELKMTAAQLKGL
jgi:hypothetical protein